MRLFPRPGAGTNALSQGRWAGARRGDGAGGGLRRGTRARRAFTLVEMLVVMAIIAALAAMLLPVLSQARNKAREVVATNELRQLMLGIGMFARTHGALPAGHPDGSEEDVDYLLEALGSSAQGIRLDPWGNEYIYVRYDKYGAPGSVAIKSPTGVPYHPKSFQLYSKGADGERDPNASHPTNSDNIWVDLPGVRVVRFSQVQPRQ